MKALISSFFILFTVVSLTVFVAFYTNSILSTFEKTIDKSFNEIASDIADKNVKYIEDEYERIRIFLVVFNSEDDLKELETLISDIKSAAESEDSAALISSKNRLMLYTKQLRRLSTFSLESIF